MKIFFFFKWFSATTHNSLKILIFVDLPTNASYFVSYWQTFHLTWCGHMSLFKNPRTVGRNISLNVHWQMGTSTKLYCTDPLYTIFLYSIHSQLQRQNTKEEKWKKKQRCLLADLVEHINKVAFPTLPNCKSINTPVMTWNLKNPRPHALHV